MTWQGGPAWKRSRPCASMLELLVVIAACRRALGRYPRQCELVEPSERTPSALRKSLEKLRALSLVETRAHFVAQDAQPICTVYALTPEALRYVGPHGA